MLVTVNCNEIQVTWCNAITNELLLILPGETKLVSLFYRFGLRLDIDNLDRVGSVMVQ